MVWLEGRQRVEVNMDFPDIVSPAREKANMSAWNNCLA